MLRKGRKWSLCCTIGVLCIVFCVSWFAFSSCFIWSLYCLSVCLSVEVRLLLLFLWHLQTFSYTEYYYENLLLKNADSIYVILIHTLFNTYITKFNSTGIPSNTVSYIFRVKKFILQILSANDTQPCVWTFPWNIIKKKIYLNWIMYKKSYLADYIIQLAIYIHRKKIRNSTVSQFNVTRPSLLFSTNSNVSVKSNCFKCKYNNMFLYKEDHWPSWPLIACSIPPVLYWPTDLTWLKFIQSCLHLLRIKSHSIYYVLSQRWTS